MKTYVYLIFLLFISDFLVSQEKEKLKFVPEKTLHFKVGTTVNFVNTAFYGLLNNSESKEFSPNRTLNFNPSADIEFDNQFSKNVGLNIDFGFMQTRENYRYINANFPNSPIDGVIICSIPHVNVSPSFYIKNTRFNAGLGLYKYYYSFNPLSVGGLNFNLNSEGLLLYSNIGVTESIDVKCYTITISVNYFGPLKRFDNGFQIALGLAL
jgi:hypothetical protein